MSSTRQPPTARTEFGHTLTIPTRWIDNDFYGHVNNVVYYSFFDTVVNRFLVDEGGFDFREESAIGLIVESGCRFHKPFAYPEPVEAALAVAHLGRSSARYEIGLFGTDEVAARADGFIVHVFVDRETNAPCPIPSKLRAALESISR